MNPLHAEILQQIRLKSGKGTQHTFVDSYLGNANPRYEITAPVLRSLSKEWMRAHKELSAKEFSVLLTSLIEGKSSTEKCFAGILMDDATKDQNAFDPRLFDRWLDQLEGWAEVDTVCTGKYTIFQLLPQWDQWGRLLKTFSKSKNLNKRRASLVLLCSPISKSDDARLHEMAFENIDRLKGHKEVLITKAISWLLRSMIKYHRRALEAYLKKNADTLPKIAVRETLVKLKTGKKTKSKV
jgi:3-methyladenine DNA glycosylase AlkD